MNWNKLTPSRIVVMVALAVIMCTTTATAQNSLQTKPKNVIIIVGDGMGVAQVSASVVAEGGNNSAFLRFPYSGFSRTNSKDNYTTDSGAGGSAVMTGHKVNNYTIAQSPDGVPHISFISQAKDRGMKCGVVVTSNILDATPASTYAHVSYRKKFDSISMQLALSGFDYFSGGGKSHFLTENRKDNLSPIDTLQKNGYTMVYTIEDMMRCTAPKICALLTEGDPPKASKRNNMLCSSVKKALNMFDGSPKGFILMIEGSQIDWACHNNDTSFLHEELADFEKMLHIVMDYAESNGETLVVVTADHETGGLTLPDGMIDKRKNTCHFSTTNHTGIMVPVFAYGPGAQMFSGIQQNSDIANKIRSLLSIAIP